MNEYVEDEFDRLAQERQNLGAHRKSKRLNPWLIALVAVLVFAPLIGWGAGMWTASDSKSRDDSAASQPVAEQSEDGEAEQSTEEKSAQEQAEKPAPEQTTAEQPPLNTAVSVQVLNGRGEAGLAKKITEDLVAGGYANATGGNYSGGSEPVVTTVFYSEETFKAEAQDIASKVGGAEVQDGSALQLGAQIVVVMR
ncbi:LytR C-terminal domain-containing protein [Arcanobacterium phocae]|uniref:LytR C-terminal domain-containing protein n=1 Tax=Arcanobacterium phocae TaxID=131112 RepID=UPI001C0EBBCE|nr:LytR C-terminal domain-containing protein [Arcanobacterium phocae]